MIRGITKSGDFSDRPGKLSVRTFSRPYAPFHDRYQEYYRASLQEYCEAVGGEFQLVHLARLPRLLAALRTARDRGYYEGLGLARVGKAIDRVADHLDKPTITPSGVFDTITGQYVLTTSEGQEHKVCVDAADSPEIASQELCEFSDIYFKTNFWPSAAYPSNVSPLVNADPLVLDRIRDLRSLRHSPKEFDVCAIAHVWDGEGVEHNIRLLKAIVDANCDTFVLGVVFGRDERILDLLRRAGIPAASRGLKASDLWRKTARSRLNVVRLGVHYCVPWRVTGSLAVGSCLVLDRPPFSVWPQPLLDGVNYLSLQLDVGPGAPVAPQHQYDHVRARIEDWLRQPERIDTIAQANGEYFDEFLEPRRVGAEIVRVVQERDRPMSSS